MNFSKQQLFEAIEKWNVARLPIFQISKPNEKLEFFGVVRFYHRDVANDGKFISKCIRVHSTSNTTQIIELLAEKVRFDMRMLSKPKYSLLEVHGSDDSREIQSNENPLFIQLSWTEYQTDGRFLLCDLNAKVKKSFKDMYAEDQTIKTNLKGVRSSKRELKSKKKENVKKIFEEEKNTEPVELAAARELYKEVPESTFTRTVSNPEAVMKKRREQKLQKRGADIIKIYGYSLSPENPYKSLLLLPSDKVEEVIQVALEKYGLGKENPADYILSKLVLPPGSSPEERFCGGWGNESILTADEMPLTISKNWKPHQGTLLFQLRHKLVKPSTTVVEDQVKDLKTQSEDSEKSSEKSESSSKKMTSSSNSSSLHESFTESNTSNPPKFIEVLPDGRFVEHIISEKVYEIGSNHQLASNQDHYIELAPDISLSPSHCYVRNVKGNLSISPINIERQIRVNNQMIQDVTSLQHGDIINLGRRKTLLFCGSGLSIEDELLHQVVTNTQQRYQKPRKRNGKVPYNENNTRRPASHYHGQPDHVTSTRPPIGRKSVSTISLPVATSNTDEAMTSLPARIDVQRQRVNLFLQRLMMTNSKGLHFQLSPAYCVYLLLRNQLEKEHSSDVVQLVARLSRHLDHNVQEQQSCVNDLAFWMANTSEILHFLMQDNQLVAIISSDLHKLLAETVQDTFRHMVACMQQTLASLLPAFLSPSDEDQPISNRIVDLRSQSINSDTPTMYDVLHILTRSMSLLRRCRVNAALTIQLFSQLFHTINCWLFNTMVARGDSRGFCSRMWAVRFRTRLAMVETWAEQQGLHLAAQCHLARVLQATNLLQSAKRSVDDVMKLCGSCYKLNAVQLRALLSNSLRDDAGSSDVITHELIDNVVAAAETHSDQDTQLLEDEELNIPFLFPEDGFSCELIRGVPSGLEDFLLNLQRESMCEFAKTSATSWTFHFNPPADDVAVAMETASRPPQTISRAQCQELSMRLKPQIVTITFKKMFGGLGLSIMAVKEDPENENSFGCYIRAVVKGAAADLDGRLHSGDEILSVDGQFLKGLDQARAAQVLSRSEDVVRLKISKHSAIFKGFHHIIDPSMINFRSSSSLNIPQQISSMTSSPQQMTSSPRKWPDQQPHSYVNRPAPVTSSTTVMSNRLNSKSASDLRRVDFRPADVTGNQHHVTRKEVSPGNIQQAIKSSQRPLDAGCHDNNDNNRPITSLSQSPLTYEATILPKEPPPTMPPRSQKIAIVNPSYQEVLPGGLLDDGEASLATGRRLRQQKKKSYQKESGTLPRHFKPSAPQQQMSIQEQLNAERDEEIIELEQRLGSLTSLEAERLKNLKDQQKFHQQVMAGKKNKKTPNMDFEVPDRPDRDRLLRMQSNNNNNNNNSATSGGRDPFTVAIKAREVMTSSSPRVNTAVTQAERDVKKVSLRRGSSKSRPLSDGASLTGKLRVNPNSPTKDPRSARERLFSNNSSSSTQLFSKKFTDPSTMTFKDRQRLFQGH